MSRILIVEDDDHIRTALRLMFEGEGFVEDGEANGVGSGCGDGSCGGMTGELADEERKGNGDGGAQAVGGRASGPGEEGGVGREVEEILHGGC